MSTSLLAHVLVILIGIVCVMLLVNVAIKRAAHTNEFMQKELARYYLAMYLGRTFPFYVSWILVFIGLINTSLLEGLEPVIKAEGGVIQKDWIKNISHPYHVFPEKAGEQVSWVNKRENLVFTSDGMVKPLHLYLYFQRLPLSFQSVLSLEQTEEYWGKAFVEYDELWGEMYSKFPHHLVRADQISDWIIGYVHKRRINQAKETIKDLFGDNLYSQSYFVPASFLFSILKPYVYKRHHKLFINLTV